MPRYYQLGNQFLDSTMPVLINQKGKHLNLEPQTWELMQYLCMHPKTIVTRDEIIEHVNQGKIVSDNTVNKMIAKVRKVLDDKPSAPRYIQTVPKRGYCLIQDVVLVDEATATSDGVIDNKTEKNTNKHIAFISMILVMVITSSLVFFQSNDKQFTNAQIKALTRHVGVESLPNISPNDQYLIFNRLSPQTEVHQWMITKIDDLFNDKALAIENNFSPIEWNQSGSAFLYVENASGQCNVFEMQVADSAYTKKRLMNCGNQQLSQLVLSKDEESLYFIARERYDDPWQIYHYDIINGTNTIVNQPNPQGLGNYAIDMSPAKDKLLILSSSNNDEAEIYVLDLENNTLEKKGQREWRLSSAIWHHDNESVVHTTSVYSRELINTTLAGKKIGTIASIPQRISNTVKRHPNGIDFYFLSFQINSDLVVLDDGKSVQSDFLNSDVYEKLPVFDSNGEVLFYLSNTLGISQIFKAELNSKKTVQLSQFDTENEFLSLSLSPNEKVLGFHERTKIVLFDTMSKRAVEHNVPFGQVLALDWLNNSTISLSIQNKDTIVSYKFDMKSNVFTLLSDEWAAIFSDKMKAKKFAIRRGECQIYEVDENLNVVRETGLTLKHPFSHLGLTVTATGSSLVYSVTEGFDSSLMRYDLSTGQTTRLGKWLFLAGFDATNERLVVAYESSRTGDVVRTVFQQ